jgi:enterochelin esterase family protein
MSRPTFTLGVVVMAAGLALPPAAFAETLLPGVELTLPLRPEGRILQIDAPSGAYVTGEFQPGGAELVLQLLSGSTPLRELSRAAGGIQTFHFVTPANARLSVAGEDGATFTIRLADVILPEAHTPQPEIDEPSPRMRALAEHLRAGGNTTAFWAARLSVGTPMVEVVGGRHVVTFLYRGAQRNVRLFGGPSSDHDPLKRLGSSDVWYRSYVLPSDTRLSYRLAPDVPEFSGTARARRVGILATAAADPLNPSVWPAEAPDAFNQWSVLELPDAPDQPGYPALPAAVEEHRFASVILGNNRRIQIYRSADFDPTDAQALLLFVFDGPRAVAEMQIPGALERLTREGRLPPVAAVFIDPIDGDTRSRELPGNPDFARFMAEELLPHVTRLLGMTPDPARTVVAGASFGGIGAAHVALSRPDLFGAAISMSGSYWWAPDGTAEGALSWMAERVLAAPRLPRFFITAGQFETGRAEDGVIAADIRETSRQLYAALRGRGAEAHWRLYAAGHDSLVWRGALTEGLIQLYGSN